MTHRRRMIFGAAFALLSACKADTRSAEEIREARLVANAGVVCHAEARLGPPMTADFDDRVGEITRWIQAHVTEPEILAIINERDPAIRGALLENWAPTPCVAAAGPFAIDAPRSQTAHGPLKALPRLSVSLTSIALNGKWVDYYPSSIRSYQPAAVRIEPLFDALITMDGSKVPRTIAFDRRVNVHALHRVLATLRQARVADAKVLVHATNGTASLSWTFIPWLERGFAKWIVDIDSRRIRVTQMGETEEHDEVIFETDASVDGRELANRLYDAYLGQEYRWSVLKVNLRLSPELHVEDAVKAADAFRMRLGVDMPVAIFVVGEPPAF